MKHRTNPNGKILIAPIIKSIDFRKKTEAWENLRVFKSLKAAINKCNYMRKTANFFYPCVLEYYDNNTIGKVVYYNEIFEQEPMKNYFSGKDNFYKILEEFQN